MGGREGKWGWGGGRDGVGWGSKRGMGWGGGGGGGGGGSKGGTRGGGVRILKSYFWFFFRVVYPQAHPCCCRYCGHSCCSRFPCYLFSW